MKKSLVLVTALLGLGLPGYGDIISFGFEGIPDSTPVGNTYAARFGIQFTNAVVQTEGVSLSPLFPPADGTNVAVDLPVDPMIITFSRMTTEFSGEFTWTAPLQFFVTYNNGTVQTASSIGQYGSATGTANFTGASVIGGGGSPNLPFIFGNSSGIEEIAISTTPGLQNGNTFTIDAVIADVATPEPDETGMIAAAMLLMAAAAKKRMGASV